MDENEDEVRERSNAMDNRAEADVWSDKTFLRDADSFDEPLLLLVHVHGIACLAPPRAARLTATLCARTHPRPAKRTSVPSRRENPAAATLARCFTRRRLRLPLPGPSPLVANDGLSSARADHTVALDSLDTNIASDYRVGGESYNSSTSRTFAQANTSSP